MMENLEDYLKSKYCEYEELDNGYYTVCSKIYELKHEYEIFTPIKELARKNRHVGIM